MKTCDLLIPLDTHTFNISRKIGLLTRKQYDLKAVIELTETLKKFDKILLSFKNKHRLAWLNI